MRGTLGSRMISGSANKLYRNPSTSSWFYAGKNRGKKEVGDLRAWGNRKGKKGDKEIQGQKVGVINIKMCNLWASEIEQEDA